MNLFAFEAALLAHLAARVDPSAILLGTFDPVDMTDDCTAPWLGKLTVLQLAATESIAGSSAALEMTIGFSVYVDLWRATPDQKTAASALFDAAGNALCGWEYAPMRYPRMATGLPTADDGRILRLSLAIAIPTFFTRT